MSGSTGEPAHITDFGRCAIEVTCDQGIVGEPKRNCSLTVTEADGYVVYDGPAGFENRGRSSQGWPKSSWPGEEALDLPAPLVAAERTAVSPR